MVNYRQKMEYDLQILGILVQAGDVPYWEESNVNRAKDGKFATKSGGGVAGTEAKKEESAGQKISSVKIREHFDEMNTDLRANLGKIPDAGAGKLNKIAQHPKVRQIRQMADDAAIQMGLGAKDAYNKVNTVINSSLAELDKRIPQSVKDKAQQMKTFADDVTGIAQVVVKVADDQHLAAAGAGIAIGVLAGMVSAIANAVAGGVVSAIASSIDAVKATIKKFQAGIADKKAATDVNKIVDNLANGISKKGDAGDSPGQAAIDITKSEAEKIPGFLEHPKIKELQKSMTDFIHDYPANLEKFRNERQESANNLREAIHNTKAITKEKAFKINDSQGGELVKKTTQQVKEFAKNYQGNLEKFRVQQADESRTRHQLIVSTYEKINKKINNIGTNIGASTGGQMVSNLITDAENAAATAIEHPDLVKKATAAALLTLHAAINLARSKAANDAIAKKLIAANPDFVDLGVAEAFNQMRDTWSQLATTAAERKHDQKLLEKIQPSK